MSGVLQLKLAMTANIIAHESPCVDGSCDSAVVAEINLVLAICRPLVNSTPSFLFGI